MATTVSLACDYCLHAIQKELEALETIISNNPSMRLTLDQIRVITDLKQRMSNTLVMWRKNDPHVSP